MPRFDSVSSLEQTSFSEYGFTYCGIPVAHSYAEILITEQILFEFNIKVVVELGVWFGGLSTLFLNVCDRYLGYDHTDVRYFNCKRLFDNNKHTFVLDDVLASDKVYGVISDFVKTDKFLLYIDNGNKKHELNKYLPLLKPGDICIAHDFNMEWTLSDIQQTLDDNNLGVIFPEVTNKLNSKQCIIAKK